MKNSFSAITLIVVGALALARNLGYLEVSITDLIDLVATHPDRARHQLLLYAGYGQKKGANQPQDKQQTINPLLGRTRNSATIRRQRATA